MDSLAVGGWLALWVRGPFGAATAQAAAGPILAITSILVAALAFQSAGDHSYAHPIQAGPGYTLWAAAFAAVVAIASSPRDSIFRTVLEWRPLAYVGRISFGLYVVHFPLLYGAVAAGLAEAGVVSLAAVTVGASFAVAAASRRWVELPALDLKHYFRYGPRTAGHSSLTEAAPVMISKRRVAPGPSLRTPRRAPTLVDGSRS
jgi:peptidoglycan/LPS O-acetylase OafA/YrhL